MRCFYAPETEGHAPAFFLARGRVVPNEERPDRAARLLAGLEKLGFAVEAPEAAPETALTAVHTTRYLAFLEGAWEGWQALPDPGLEVVANLHPPRDGASYPDGLVGRAGWHMADTACPLGERTWAAARRGADTAAAAAQAVLGGAPAAYALCRPPGHHASSDNAAGHCFLNNAAIASEMLRGAHERVAVLDIDVHHGNGTQAVFWERPDVLTVSVHTDPSTFYPFYTGYDFETGGGAGEGANLNLPLPRGAGDAPWHAAIGAALERVRAFGPGVLVLSLGLDSHASDPFRGMSVSTPAFAEAAGAIAALRLPTVIVQEGGYLSDDLTRTLVSFLGGWAA